MEVAESYQAGPVGLSELKLVRSDSPLGVQLCSPSPDALRIRIPKFVPPNRLPLLFALPIDGRMWAEEKDTLAQFLSAHLTVAVQVVDATGESIAVAAPVAVRATGSDLEMRLLIRASLWPDAHAFTLRSLTLAGRQIPCPTLPLAVQIRFMHAVFVLDESGSMQASWAGVVGAYNTFVTIRARGSSHPDGECGTSASRMNVQLRSCVELATCRPHISRKLRQ